ncbi:HalOD1 output domain-containing protein [Natronolimnohabitans sp. A-GB9]|uniref:HalOD1 output domain-containing protein n=1 Tax=Natronolimnohabitans sp. A-GB9 TaxID=3069757 RepID=UPI0027B4C117|nr:HalOD1 output domain-containing protein [Natronolimnohabitans sp. A-GB9]MDQ2049067.1 HalOD1 output domain-containing protein [Natronolimnohabitans sp. A-GB9]
MSTSRDQPRGEPCQECITYTASDDESLFDAVITALQKAAAETPSSDDVETPSVGGLSPLFESIDPDALDRLFSSTGSGATRSGSVSFTHDGYEVTATAAGEVVVSSE